MSKRVSATEIARNFSDFLNRLQYRNEDFIVVRNGREVCRITPAHPIRCRGADLRGLLAALPKPDEAYLDGLEQLQGTQPLLPDIPWAS